MPSKMTMTQKHEAYLKKHGSHALEHALKKLTLPFEVTSLLKFKHKPNKADHVLHQDDDASYSGLTKARNVLNELYAETVEELDLVTEDCTTYETSVRGQIEENREQRTLAGETIAKARGDMSEAQGIIQSASTAVTRIRNDYNDHQATCHETLTAQEAQEKILDGDYAVGQKILNMTACDAASTADAQEPLTLMECSKGTKGLDYRFQGQGHALVRSMKSKRAQFAFQRAAKLALGKHLGQHGYHLVAKKKPVSLVQVASQHAHKHHTLQKLRADPNNVTLAPDDPGLQGFEHATFFKSDDGSKCSNAGCVAITMKEACLDASQTLGFGHADVSEVEEEDTARGCIERGGSALVFNSAAEDIDAKDGDMPICQCELEEPTEAEMAAVENDEPTKCSVSPKNCPRLFDAISTMVAEILDALNKVRQSLHDQTVYCDDTSRQYAADIGDLEAEITSNNVKLAQATEAINTNEELLRIKDQEFDTLTSELAMKLDDCHSKYREADDTLCGVKTVRTELYELQGTNPFMQDCEVSDWVSNECSASCGGGERTLTRSVVTAANEYGAPCPPLTMTEECGMGPCPIDCVMNDWMGWSACSKDCGGGVQQRSRHVNVDPQHGGRVCDATQESAQCNNQACDVPCELAEWAEWGECSKQCSGGFNTRYKYVAVEALGDGHCPKEHAEERVEKRDCNTQECDDNLVCQSKVDVIFVVDGSGSVTYHGFWAEKEFVQTMLSRMPLGENVAKAGLIEFSSGVNIPERMTYDNAQIKETASDMAWPMGSTATAIAIETALSVLAADGRADADSVIFVLTDGMPNDAMAVATVAEKARQVARLVFVAIGPNLDYDSLASWASYPPEENVLYAQDFEDLLSHAASFIPNICQNLGCSEAMTGNGQDYLGCQTRSRSGYTCQSWAGWYPWSHYYTPWNFPSGNLGDFNYCRNPDGDSTIWCVTADWSNFWDFCDPL